LAVHLDQPVLPNRTIRRADGYSAGREKGVAMTNPDAEVHADDFEDPEDFAEAVGIDPTAEQVAEYREETGQEPQEPTDPTGGSGA
jgi:hypothetical protein